MVAASVPLQSMAPPSATAEQPMKSQSEMAGAPYQMLIAPPYPSAEHALNAQPESAEHGLVEVETPALLVDGAAAEGAVDNLGMLSMAVHVPAVRAVLFRNPQPATLAFESHSWIAPA